MPNSSKDDRQSPVSDKRPDIEAQDNNSDDGQESPPPPPGNPHGIEAREEASTDAQIDRYVASDASSIDRESAIEKPAADDIFEASNDLPFHAPAHPRPSDDDRRAKSPEFPPLACAPPPPALLMRSAPIFDGASLETYRAPSSGSKPPGRVSQECSERSKGQPYRASSKLLDSSSSSPSMKKSALLSSFLPIRKRSSNLPNTCGSTAEDHGTKRLEDRAAVKLEDDDDDDAPDPFREKIVDGVMKSFMDWLDRRLRVKTMTTPGGPARGRTAVVQPQKPGMRAGERLLAAKRRHSGDSEEDDDEDSEKPLRAKSRKGPGSGDMKIKLACPFFKHNPRKYKNQRPCCGPGWDQVHRIKEHLYRKHSLPRFTCHRCCEPFEAEEQLQAHARLATPCPVREPLPFSGMTVEQERKLRSRKKNGVKELSEGEKWTQMYRILFPDVRENEIPSPYYEENENRTNLAGYEDYIRRELPPMVRRQLEEVIERELPHEEVELKQRVIEIARNLQLALFRGYQQLDADQTADSPSLASSSTGSESMTASTPSTESDVARSDVVDPLHVLDDPYFSMPREDDFDFSFLSSISDQLDAKKTPLKPSKALQTPGFLSGTVNRETDVAGGSKLLYSSP